MSDFIFSGFVQCYYDRLFSILTHVECIISTTECSQIVVCQRGTRFT